MDKMEAAFNLVYRLRSRAEIRRKATCRGPDDRLANDLDEAANRIEQLEYEVSHLRHRIYWCPEGEQRERT